MKHFLQSQDADLVVYSFGEHLAFGDIKGLWLDSASQDAQAQSFFGRLSQGRYPAYLIYHDIIEPNSPTRGYLMDYYGYDLKAQGYDRRAEYLKGIFEIFDFDSTLKQIASDEFNGEKNPLPSYVWKEGIRSFTTISKAKPSKNNGNGTKGSINVGNNHEGLLSVIISLVGSVQGNRSNDQQSKFCDSILFIASLGGGTGTGFINPITSYVRSEELAFPIFALGILTEKGSDARHATEGQRDLGAVIAMNDLLTKEAGTGIDGLILIDNQILAKRFKRNYQAMDNVIYSALRPLLDLRNYPGVQLQDDSQAIKRVIWEKDIEYSASEKNENRHNPLPPVLVPCYHSRKASDGSEKSLVEHALREDGMLFPCDPNKADRVYVFARGFFSYSGLIDSVHEITGLPVDKIKVYRKLGDNRSEDVLILLRNPYGGVPGDYKHEGTFEKRIYDIIEESVKYMEENQKNIIEYLGYKEITKSQLRNYFYGASGLREKLKEALGRLEKGQRPIFLSPLRIFDGGDKAVPGFATCENGQETMGLNKAQLEELVKAELKKILSSNEFKAEIREILKS